MISRREFLQQSGSGAVALSFHEDWFEAEPSEHPPYPSIPSSVLEEQGWSMRGEKSRDQFKREDCKWSTSTYQWDSLRERVREATGGQIDIPLGGLVAYRIGDTSSVFDSDNTFALPWLAKRELDDPIKDHFKNYLHEFSKTGFTTVGDIDWSLAPLFGVPSSSVMQECLPSGTLTTESVGSVQMHQFNLDYELNDRSSNMSATVDIHTVDLEFFGWLAGWSHKQHIYAVGGIHPNATGDYCGLDNPHIEEALSEALDEQVNLNLDETLYGRMHTVMGSIE